MFYVAAATSRTSATPSTARRMARSTPRSCSAWRASPAARRCCTTCVPPTQTHKIEPVRDVQLDGQPTMACIATAWSRPAQSRPRGNVDRGRMPLFFNSDVLMGVVRPTEELPRRPSSTATARPTRCSSSTRAAARFESDFGPMRYGPGDYIVIPIGTTWRLAPDDGAEHRILYVESPSEIVPPKRYRNDWGQLLEHSPYSSATSACRTRSTPRDEAGDFVDHVKVRGRITAYHYRHHPFDVVGWDGYLFPYIFNIGDFEPITGRVHQPPPVHQTFAGRNYVVCSFVPRKFDYHPLAIPAPYNHSNINSDEVIYYVAGNFMSRRGVEISSFTLHPAGIPHGPHPGTVEASIGKEATEELAVMVDTFHPLQPDAARPPSSRTTHTRIRGCRPTDDGARGARASPSAARRRSPTDLPKGRGLYTAWRWEPMRSGMSC